jgi:hypothetical protein
MPPAFNRVKAMLRTLLRAAALTVLLSGAANAQFNSSDGNTAGGGSIPMNMLNTRRHLTPEEAQREREIESRYNETVSEKIPDKKSSNDPWGGMRSGAAAASTTKQRK